MARLANPYAPRRPTESVLYGVVREHLATFLRFTKENYARRLPRYVENELRAYLKCGIFAHGFARLHCESCGHDLLVAFSCKGRGLCPSCGRRRMASTAAHLVDRVLPTVPVRQWVLSLPFALRRLAAFDPKALSKISRVFVEEIFAHYRGCMVDSKCGAVTFVQRFGGSLNLNVHLHVVVLDGVFVGDAESVRFIDSPAPTRMELHTVVKRTRERLARWLARSERPSSPEEAPDAISACADSAMQRGLFVELPAREGDKSASDIPEAHAAAEHEGFNLHAGVRIAAEDDLGRERLCRYGARPAFASSRFRKLSDGRIAFRVKYADKGKTKHRIMTPVELLARVAALIPPPRYPLVRYHGVLAPASPWRDRVIPRPPETARSCTTHEKHAAEPSPPPPQSRPLPVTPPGPRVSAIRVAPNVLSIPHWKRLNEGAFLARSPRMDWATLLRRTFDIDVRECPKCGSDLELRGVVTDATSIAALLCRLQIEPPPKLARARDPTTLSYADAVD